VTGTASKPPASKPAASPYVGPKPFTLADGDRFHGRSREIADLIALLAAHRVLLLHASSGAGKTSLLNAGLRPLAPADEFLILPPARVRGRPDDPKSRNAQSKDDSVFVTNYLADLSAQLRDAFPENPPPLPRPGQTLHQYALEVERVLLPRPPDRTIVYVVDQFEELFTTNLADWNDREPFFRQAAMLARPRSGSADSDPPPNRRLLLSMRSDFVARVESFAHLMPERLNARYHLERLNRQQAIEAIERPAAHAGRPFDEGAADALADRLAEQRIATEKGPQTIEGEFVEPVQLQVVCDRLWRSLPNDAKSISRDDVDRYGNVDEALREYYELAIRDAHVAEKVPLRRIRGWFDKQLIAAGGFRGQAFVDMEKGEVAGLPIAAVDRLQDAYHIIRSETRAGARWVEISHDRFVEPIRLANEADTRRLKQRNDRLGIGIATIVATILFTVLGIIQQQTATQKELASLTADARDTAQTLSTRAAAALALLTKGGSSPQTLGTALSILADAGAIRRQVRIPTPDRTLGTRLAASADGMLLLGSWDGGSWTVRNVGRESGNLGEPRILVEKIAETPRHFAWSPDGSRLAIAQGNSIRVIAAGTPEDRIFELGSRALEPERPLSLDAKRRLAFGADGKSLAALLCVDKACSTAELEAWNVDDPATAMQIPTPADLDVASFAMIGQGDGAWIAIAGCRRSGPQPTPTGPSTALNETPPKQATQSGPVQGGPAQSRLECVPQIAVSAPLPAPDPKGASEKPIRLWAFHNPDGQVAWLQFSRLPMPDSNAVLMFEELARREQHRLLKSFALNTEATRSDRLEPPDAMIPNNGRKVDLVEVDNSGFAWRTDDGSIAFADRSGASALVHPLAETASSKFVRAKHRPQTTQYVTADQDGLLLLDASGRVDVRYQAPSDLFAVSVSGNGQFAAAYGRQSLERGNISVIVDLNSEESLTIRLDRKTGKLVRDIRGTPAWAKLFDGEDQRGDSAGALAFQQGTSRLLRWRFLPEMSIDVADLSAASPFEAVPVQMTVSPDGASDRMPGLQVYDVHYLSTAPVAIAATNAGTYLANVETGVVKLARDTDGTDFVAVASSPDGQTLFLVGSRTAVLKVADVEKALASSDAFELLSSATRRSIRIISDAAFRSDGRFTYALGFDPSGIGILDPASGELAPTTYLPIEIPRAYGLALAPDNDTLLITGQNGAAFVDVGVESIQRALCQIILVAPPACTR